MRARPRPKREACWMRCCRCCSRARWSGSSWRARDRPGKRPLICCGFVAGRPAWPHQHPPHVGRRGRAFHPRLRHVGGRSGSGRAWRPGHDQPFGSVVVLPGSRPSRCTDSPMSCIWSSEGAGPNAGRDGPLETRHRYSSGRQDRGPMLHRPWHRGGDRGDGQNR